MNGHENFDIEAESMLSKFGIRSMIYCYTIPSRLLSTGMTGLKAHKIEGDY